MSEPRPMLVLKARAEARAALFFAGLFDLAEALEPLEDYARKSGLVEEIGCDAVAKIISTAFELDGKPL